MLSGAFLLALGGAMAMSCGGSSGESPTCDPSVDPTCACDPTADAACTSGDGGGDSASGDGISKLDGAPTDGPKSPPGKCSPSGASCAVGTDCCNLNCTPGKTCGAATTCTADGAACTAAADCCGGNCTGGSCVPLSTTCKTAGNPCAAGGDCCSGLCTGGTCDIHSSFCFQIGDACTTGSACCSGICNIAAGATLGSCGLPPTGPSFCSGVDGTKCGACTDCCSRVCAPYGPSGVSICQPAEGCHVTGDLCTKDGDCCGAAGTGLPGDGHVTCDKSGDPAGLIGICRNPMACNPEGAVCHYKSAAVCGTSAARADCCGALGSKGGACIPDKFGVPRCYGGEPCHKAGETCADSYGCCDGTPCVPGPDGVLRCSASACVPAAGPCTVDADCCVGASCSRPIGSTSGTCTPTSPPPPPPPADAGPDAPPTDAVVDETTPPPTCALYGQSCATDGDCCSGVPCLTDTGVACAGAAGCLCRFPPIK
ncbi:MAG: hypothetical protein NVSMB47_03730 [Polyangiales bacterium]